MTRLPSVVRSLLREVAHVDRAKLSVVTALRNTVGVVAPLALGAATGHLLAGVTACIGALNVAFLDRPDPHRWRVARMLLAGLCSAVSVFIGSVTGAVDPLAVALAALWGFGGGLLVALGPAAGDIGMVSIVQLLVFAGQPLTLGGAAGAAGLILAGGLFQAALSVADWPVQPFGPQRAALARVFCQLAAYARTCSDPAIAPPITAAITEASTMLTRVEGATSTTYEALRALLDETERIRLEVLALGHAREHLDDATLHGWIDSALAAAGEVLEALAATLSDGRGHAAPVTALPLHRIQAAADAVQQVARAEPSGPLSVQRTAILAYIEALGGQLRAATRLATEGNAAAAGSGRPFRVYLAWPRYRRVRAPLSVLRANFTLRSTACRHALRLAACLTAADALGRALVLPRAYWVPMTVALVLKPDFATTVTRGLGRLAGTALGLLLATALVHVAFGSVTGRVVLVGILMFALRSLGPANYGLFAIAVTGLVVTLTSFAGASPEATIAERGMGTLLGGVLALGAYALWPTWERTQTPTVLADLLDAYRRYFTAVIAGYLDPHHPEPCVDAARQAARLTRTNAEASIDRLRSEPVRSVAEVERADRILAHSHRFVRSVMVLDAGLYHNPDTRPVTPAPASLQTFSADVETILGALATFLRDPSQPLPALPSLRTDLRAAPGTAGPGLPEDESPLLSGDRLAILVAEADRITDSVNTLTGLVRGDLGTAILCTS